MSAGMGQDIGHEKAHEGAPDDIDDERRDRRCVASVVSQEVYPPASEGTQGAPQSDEEDGEELAASGKRLD